MFIYDYSQRRKQKEAEIVGVASGVNSLTTPRYLNNDDYGEEIQGEKDRPSSSFTTQSSVLSRPRSTRRKSLAAEKPPVVPEGKKPQRTSLAPAHKQSSKMDLAKATSIMGFTSSRWADASQVTIAFVNYDEMRIIFLTIVYEDKNYKMKCFLFQTGKDPKTELDKAQFNRMQELLKRKRTTQRELDVILTLIIILR